MKRSLMKHLAIAGFAVLLSVGFTACGEEAENTEQKAEAGMIYACPMHPEVTSQTPGDCSKCGMPLEKISVEENNKLLQEE